MAFLTDRLRHWHDCRFKQEERAQRIQALTTYRTSLNSNDRDILSQPVSKITQDVRDKKCQAKDVLAAYGKVALRAHEATNCLTEVMIEKAEGWIKDGSINLSGPLAGMPISIKDNIIVGGFDACFGFSAKTGKPYDEDGPMVRILKAAGAVPFVKTNVPITMLSFEATNDVWGRCTNPHNAAYGPGGSSGGEGALLAFGGSRIGIGSDVAGSVRLPAAWAGCYSLRCSTGRWLKSGGLGSMSQDGVPAVASPLARTMEDLIYFTKSIIGMEPWKYDHAIHPIPWRSQIVDKIQSKSRLRIGIVQTDGVVDPSPACARALDITRAALRAQGHELVELALPDPQGALSLAAQLLCADGCVMADGLRRSGEWQDLGVRQMLFVARLPRPIHWLYHAWVKYVRRDDVWARLIADWRPKTILAYWQLVGQRDVYRKQFYDWWQGEAKVDFLLMPVNATPALPHGCMHDAVSSCGYTFMFNMLDYTAGVLPVTHVDKSLDQLPPDFSLSKLNGVAQGALKHYDATAMHGLPVAVQVVGQRLEEEKVLACMQRVEDALGKEKYELLEIE